MRLSAIVDIGLSQLYAARQSCVSTVIAHSPFFYMINLNIGYVKFRRFVSLLIYSRVLQNDIYKAYVRLLQSTCRYVFQTDKSSLFCSFG